MQNAACDRGSAGVVIVAGQDERAGAVLLERAVPADCPAIGEAVGAVEGEYRTVAQRDIAGDRAGAAPVAHQSASIADRGPAGVGVGAGEGEGAGTYLGERAAAGDEAGIGEGIRAVESEVGAGKQRDIGQYRTGGAAVAELQ